MDRHLVETDGLVGRLQSENEALRRAVALHDDLVDLALSERGVAAMVDRISAAIGNPVSLSDQLFHHLVSCPRGEHGDRHRRESMANGGTPRAALDDPVVGRYFRRAADERQPVLFPSFPAHGMDHRRMMTAIVVNDEPIAFVTVLEEAPFADNLAETMERSAKLLALELLKRRVALETELHLMTDFLGDLLSGRYANRDAVVSRAGFLGVDLFRSWIVLLIGVDDLAALCRATGTMNPVAAHQHLFEIIRRRVRQRLPGGIVAVQGESIVMLHPAGAGDPRALAEELRKETDRMLPGITITVAVSGICQSLDDFPVRYAEARRALDVAAGLHRKNQTVALEELGLYGLLFRREDQDELRRFTDRLLGPLFAYDAHRGTALIETLDAFLAEGGAFRSTARRLGVHLNTLRGRLDRIEQLCGVDPREAKARLDLQIALEIARVAGQNGSARLAD
jgi:sugar diacid utilization regulator